MNPNSDGVAQTENEQTEKHTKLTPNPSNKK
jgi:hypothetical protein